MLAAATCRRERTSWSFRVFARMSTVGRWPRSFRDKLHFMVQYNSTGWPLITSLEIPRMFGDEKLCYKGSFLKSCQNSIFSVTMESIACYKTACKIRVVFPFLVIPAMKALNCGGFLREKLKRGREKPAPNQVVPWAKIFKNYALRTRTEGGTTSKSGGTRRMHNAVVHVHPS